MSVGGRSQRKPEWLRAKLYSSDQGMEVEKLLRRLGLNTVCSEAKCPNLGECFNRRTATFMILGSHCTRNCRFCNVQDGLVDRVDMTEPVKIASAVKELGLRYVVITSVTRDDLPDGGAGHFAEVIHALKDLDQELIIEVLIPDFKGDLECLMKVIEARPDVINHNIETIERLYPKVRSMALYERSLEVLKNIKEYGKGIISKSGFMLGLGESDDEVISLMKDLKAAKCDILTIGQYLQPSIAHYPVQAYIKPEVFDRYKSIGLEMGFRGVASGPLVRSSYFADEKYRAIKDMSQ